MSSILKYAPAKVNLMLHIVGKKNEYHEIQSIFTFVDTIYDTMEFDCVIEFNKKSAIIPGIKKEDNLLHKSRDFLIQHFSNLFIPDVKVKKNISEKSGLGGGSSDSACFINYVLDINKIKQKDKIEIAQKAHVLGMDIPIFLYQYIYKQKILLLEGIGLFNEIKSINCQDKLFIRVFNTKTKLSTKTVFANYCEQFEKKQSITTLTLDLLKNTKNSLQETAILLCPEIENTLAEIQNTGAIIAKMSGSGSSCYGIYLFSSDNLSVI